ncbi:hypothetical protein [Motilimonas pumila]|uniref:Uncharacterized protein n=1 Tax=Motilimonas pumila TaxID=2303987 RepID=A0A418Y9D8_9GAMM|nr:hypothetical protein [Motilimonas pumila]RJG37158.1 hypothetical protein D1Z90_19945 [Motilimonas pumila]
MTFKANDLGQEQPELPDAMENGNESTSAEGATECDIKDHRAYFIEVLGFDHPEAQKVTVQPLEGSDNDTFFDFEGKPSEKQEKTATSTIHRWETMACKPLAAQLEIKKAEGGTIKLPLFDDVELTKQQPIRQDHVIAPFVPVVQHFSNDNQDTLSPVSCRGGFLYLLKDGRFWREVEIVFTEEGNIEYSDVDLLSTRESGAESSFNISLPRKVEGQALEEIWLPIRVENTWTSSMSGFFCEYMLTSERLNYLEANVEQLAKRSVSFSLKEPEVLRPNQKMKTLFWLQDLPAQRPRQPLIERLYHNPHSYLSDLSGAYPEQELQQAQSAITFPAELPNNKRLPTTALNHVVDSEILPIDQCKLGEAFKNQGQVESIFDTASSRKICALPFEDIMEELTSILKVTQASFELLGKIEQWASSDPDYDFAALVHQLILQPKLTDADGSKVDNEYYKEYARFVDTASDAPLYRLLKTQLRLNLTHAASFYQKNLLGLMLTKSVDTCLADYHSFNGSDYQSGFHITGQILNALVLSPYRLNAVYMTENPEAGTYFPEGLQYVSQIFEDPDNPIHQMLFPTEADVPQEQPLPDSLTAEVNQGDGRCRPGLLATLGRAENRYAVGEPVVFEIISLDLSAKQDDSTPLAAYAKRLMNDAGAVLDGINGALTAVISAKEKALNAKQAALAAPQQQASTLIAQQAKTQQLEAGVSHRAGVTESLSTQASMAVPEDLMKLKMNLYGPFLRLLKAADPKLMGSVVTIKSNQLDLAQYRVIGFDDQGKLFGFTDAKLKAGHGGRLYGGVYNNNGQLLGETNKARYTKELGITAGTKSETIFFVIEKGSSADQLLKQWQRSMDELLTLRKELAANIATNRVLAAELAQAVSKYIPNSHGKSPAQIQAQLDALLELDRAEIKGLSSSRLQQYANKVMDHPIVGGAVFWLEAYNVQAELNSSKLFFQQERHGRVVVGLTSAFYDFTLASIVILEKANFNQRLSARISIFMANELVEEAKIVAMKRNSGPFAQSILPRVITNGALINLGGGILTIVVCLNDALFEYNSGDKDAATAMLGVAVGVGVVTLTAWAGISGLIPVLGWVVAIVCFIGFFIFNDSPMEQLLKFGPLSKEPNIDHLNNDSEEAFYRLVHLVAGYHIEVVRNPYFQQPFDALPPHLQAIEPVHTPMVLSPDYLPEQPASSITASIQNFDLFSLTSNKSHTLSVRSCNWLVKVRSGLAMLFGEVTEEVVLATRQLTIAEGHGGQSVKMGLNYQCREITQSGSNYYITMPEDTYERYGMTLVTNLYRPAVRLQYKANRGGKAFAFPAPMPDNPLRYNPTDQDNNTPRFTGGNIFGKHEYWLKSEDYRPANFKDN